MTGLLAALLAPLGLAGVATPGGLVGAVIGFAAKLLTDWISDQQRDAALKDLGAAAQANAARLAAEGQEHMAATAATAAAAAPIDDDDGFRRATP